MQLSRALHIAAAEVPVHYRKSALITGFIFHLGASGSFKVVGHEGHEVLQATLGAQQDTYGQSFFFPLHCPKGFTVASMASNSELLLFLLERSDDL